MALLTGPSKPAGAVRMANIVLHLAANGLFCVYSNSPQVSEQFKSYGGGRAQKATEMSSVEICK